MRHMGCGHDLCGEIGNIPALKGREDFTGHKRLLEQQGGHSWPSRRDPLASSDWDSFGTLVTWFLPSRSLLWVEATPPNGTLVDG